MFERVFKEFGLPKANRTDSGVPVASAHALFGLRKLYVWWLRLGIRIERIKPGHPEQDDRHERMHLTLDMKYPAELYQPSPRPYRGVGKLEYPFHDRTVTVTHCGRICPGKRKINFSTVFAGPNVGIKEVSDKIWRVTIVHYDSGFFDHETCRLEPVDNAFEPKVLPMSPA